MEEYRQHAVEVFLKRCGSVCPNCGGELIDREPVEVDSTDGTATQDCVCLAPECGEHFQAQYTLTGVVSVEE